MNPISKKYIAILFILSTVLASHSLAQHKHNSDTTKTDVKKMNCCKNMSNSDQEMKSEKTEMNEKAKIDLEEIDVNKDGKVFMDGMCKDVVKDETSNCPKCGMKLKEITLDEAKKFIEKDNMNNQTSGGRR